MEEESPLSSSSRRQIDEDGTDTAARADGEGQNNNSSDNGGALLSSPAKSLGHGSIVSAAATSVSTYGSNGENAGSGGDGNEDPTGTTLSFDRLVDWNFGGGHTGEYVDCYSDDFDRDEDDDGEARRGIARSPWGSPSGKSSSVGSIGDDSAIMSNATYLLEVIEEESHESSHRSVAGDDAEENGESNSDPDGSSTAFFSTVAPSGEEGDVPVDENEEKTSDAEKKQSGRLKDKDEDTSSLSDKRLGMAVDEMRGKLNALFDSWSDLKTSTRPDPVSVAGSVARPGRLTGVGAAAAKRRAHLASTFREREGEKSGDVLRRRHVAVAATEAAKSMATVAALTVETKDDAVKSRREEKEGKEEDNLRDRFVPPAPPPSPSKPKAAGRQQSQKLLTAAAQELFAQLQIFDNQEFVVSTRILQPHEEKEPNHDFDDDEEEEKEEGVCLQVRIVPSAAKPERVSLPNFDEDELEYFEQDRSRMSSSTRSSVSAIPLVDRYGALNNEKHRDSRKRYSEKSRRRFILVAMAVIMTAAMMVFCLFEQPSAMSKAVGIFTAPFENGIGFEGVLKKITTGTADQLVTSQVWLKETLRPNLVSNVAGVSETGQKMISQVQSGLVASASSAKHTVGHFYAGALETLSKIRLDVSSGLSNAYHTLWDTIFGQSVTWFESWVANRKLPRTLPKADNGGGSSGTSSVPLQSKTVDGGGPSSSLGGEANRLIGAATERLLSPANLEQNVDKTDKVQLSESNEEQPPPSEVNHMDYASSLKLRETMAKANIHAPRQTPIKTLKRAHRQVPIETLRVSSRQTRNKTLRGAPSRPRFERKRGAMATSTLQQNSEKKHITLQKPSAPAPALPGKTSTAKSSELAQDAFEDEVALDCSACSDSGEQDVHARGSNFEAFEAEGTVLSSKSGTVQPPVSIEPEQGPAVHISVDEDTDYEVSENYGEITESPQESTLESEAMHVSYSVQDSRSDEQENATSNADMEKRDEEQNSPGTDTQHEIVISACNSKPPNGLLTWMARIYFNTTAIKQEQNQLQRCQSKFKE